MTNLAASQREAALLAALEAMWDTVKPCAYRPGWRVCGNPFTVMVSVTCGGCGGRGRGGVCARCAALIGRAGLVIECNNCRIAAKGATR